MTDTIVQPQQPPSPQTPLPAPASGMSIAALTLGIISIVCCTFLTGIPAIIFGHLEQKSIREGRSSMAGFGMAKAGFIMGIIGTILSVVFFMFYFILGLGATLLGQ